MRRFAPLWSGLSDEDEEIDRVEARFHNAARFVSFMCHLVRPL